MANEEKSMTAPKSATPKASTPKASTPKSAAPKASAPKTATPKASAPKASAPKASAPKSTAPKTATPKASAPKASAPKASAPKSTAPKTATPKATPKTAVPKPTAPKPAGQEANAQNIVNAQNVANVNENVESAKQAELSQKVGDGGASNVKKKRRNRIIIYIIIALLIIALAVGSYFLVTSLTNNDVPPMAEIELTDPEGSGSVEEGLTFQIPVTDYVWGEIIDRGIAVSNISEADILICFKIEIYDETKENLIEKIKASIPALEQSRDWTISKTVQEVVNGKTVTSVYYYFNDLIKGNTEMDLFTEYVVNADAQTQGEYANDTVSPVVTVQYINATKDSLNSAEGDCWIQAPREWRDVVNSKIK